MGRDYVHWGVLWWWGERDNLSGRNVADVAVLMVVVVMVELVLGTGARI